MVPFAVAVGWLSAGFAVPTAMGTALVVASLVVGFRLYRSGASPLLVAGALLGSVAVVAHLAVAAGEPASTVGFLLGSVGGICWYVVGVSAVPARAKDLNSDARLSGIAHSNSIVHQSLVVGGILWIAGTVTVTTTVSPQEWPIRWSLLIGLFLAAIAAVPRIGGQEPTAEIESRRLFLGVLTSAFLLPAAVGVVFGREILFVAYLIAVVIAVIGWLLVRVATGDSS